MRHATISLAGFAATGVLAVTAAGQFTGEGVTLNARIPLSGFASNPGSGNDCWGYTSPSGREYALMGLSNALAVVEITDPNNPDIIAEISHSSSSWGDVKTYGTRAYVVNESGGGIDVVDLTNVDDGIVTLVDRVMPNGVSSSHNVAIDVDSGYLYALGSNASGGRLVACDLNADPDSPPFVGAVSSDEGAYVHDAQIVTYDSGPYAGQQIAFCANGGTGLDIYNVTDKSSMVRLSRSLYPNLSYCHQCWLSEDRTLLYVNDETDGVNETIVFDVTDLENPVELNTFSSGLNAADHNLYVRGELIFEADYHSGLRIFDAASDPVDPAEVAWFDTFPADDGGGFGGAWSTYPFFPSGRILISDTDSGLFIVTQAEPLIAIDYPDGQPEFIDPSGDTLRVEITELEPGGLVGGTETLHYRDGESFVETPLVSVGGVLYDAVFPAFPCGTLVDYYVSAEMSDGNTLTNPIGAPNASFATTAALGEIVAFNDDMEVDLGWTVINEAVDDGAWDRGVPIGGGDRGDPATDFDGSGQCWLTDNEDGNSDLDGGPTRLTSPVIDLAGLADPQISYARWFTNDDADEDRLVVDISDDDGGSWTEVETVAGGPGWTVHTFRVADFADPAGTIRMRFSATDNPNNSVTEAGIDALRALDYECDAGQVGDIDGDGDTDFADLLLLLSQWGACPEPPADCPADLDGSGAVDFTDLLLLLSNWG